MRDYSNWPNDVAAKMREQEIANMEYDIRTVLSVFSRELVRREEQWEHNNALYAETKKAEGVAYDHYCEEREKRERVQAALHSTSHELRQTYLRLQRLGSIIKAVREAGVDVDAIARKHKLVVLDAHQHEVEVEVEDGR